MFHPGKRQSSLLAIFLLVHRATEQPNHQDIGLLTQSPIHKLPIIHLEAASTGSPGIEEAVAVAGSLSEGWAGI